MHYLISCDNITVNMLFTENKHYHIQVTLSQNDVSIGKMTCMPLCNPVCIFE